MTLYILSNLPRGPPLSLFSIMKTTHTSVSIAFIRSSG